MSQQSLWRIRATAWELLAFSLKYPEETLREVIASGEWAAAAREITQALDTTLSEEFERNVIDAQKEAAATEGLRSLRVEATRLFIGQKLPECAPYEGMWRAADDNVKPLLHVNPHSMRVERFCRACGLEHPEGTNEPLDHIASECELLEYLALRAADTAAEEDVAPDDLPGGSAEAAYTAFMLDHASSWMLRFADKLKETTRRAYYRCVAELMMHIMENEQSGQVG